MENMDNHIFTACRKVPQKARGTHMRHCRSGKMKFKLVPAIGTKAHRQKSVGWGIVFFKFMGGVNPGLFGEKCVEIKSRGL